MEAIRMMLVNLIVLVFLTAVLDLLMPNSTFRSYIKMIMGVFTVLILLQPVVQLLQKDHCAELGEQIKNAIQTNSLEEF
ncbi:MAG: stage III sporulation protein AF [Peptococcaceae bacterium]|nr:stage III sporulation protein AF [Peptococcaceae bacterium]MBP3342542.1 stage III sporulation protein AF [Peptococcaceae bacterium]MBP3585065.1 stage III sporulation protein AF [Peptococcaceae bacterium]MBP3624479.1 stage III sporulation protein AF [Peptococcaceae bacterium]